jgi:hypothetical protein
MSPPPPDQELKRARPINTATINPKKLIFEKPNAYRHTGFGRHGFLKFPGFGRHGFLKFPS